MRLLSLRCSPTVRLPRTPSTWSVSTIGGVSDVKRHSSVNKTTPTAERVAYDGREIGSLSDGPATGHPDFTGVDYVPFEVLKYVCPADMQLVTHPLSRRRASAFAHKSDPVNGRCAIGELPLDVQWGKTTQNEQFLCDNKGVPITLWLLVKLRKKWINNLQDEPYARVCVIRLVPQRR